MKFWVNGFLNYTNQGNYLIDLKYIYIYCMKILNFFPNWQNFSNFFPDEYRRIGKNVYPCLMMDKYSIAII